MLAVSAAQDSVPHHGLGAREGEGETTPSPDSPEKMGFGAAEALPRSEAQIG